MESIYSLSFNIKDYFTLRIISLNKNHTNHKPVHVCPFPVYPVLHIHVKLPTVLVQAALVSQLSVLVVHSFMSKEWMCYINKAETTTYCTISYIR